MLLLKCIFQEKHESVAKKVIKGSEPETSEILHALLMCAPRMHDDNM